MGIFVTASCAGLGGLLFGYDTGIINGVLFELRDAFGFDVASWQMGLVVSIAVLGAFFGTPIGGYVGGRWGRRPAIALGDVLFVVGAAVIAFANSFAALLCGRFILGLGVGVASVIVPMYIAEVSPPHLRGALVTLNNLFITGGQFLAAGIAAIVVHWDLGGPDGWRYLLGAGGIPALLQGLLLILLPESPRWLIAQNKVEQAASVLQATGVRDVHQTVTEIVEETHAEADATFSSLFRGRRMRRRLIVGCGFQALQQFCGINTLMYYSGAILSKAGFTGTKAPILWSVPLAFTNAAFTVVGIFTMDRWGRKLLAYASLAGCLFATMMLAAVGFIAEFSSLLPQNAVGWSSLSFLLLYLACFAPGMGPVPWVVNSEIYPTKYRAHATSTATMVNWLSNAVVSQLFPLLLRALTSGPTFLIISGFCLLGLWFVMALVPETNGRSLEEIEQCFDEHSRDKMRRRERRAAKKLCAAAASHAADDVEKNEGSKRRALKEEQRRLLYGCESGGKSHNRSAPSESKGGCGSGDDKGRGESVPVSIGSDASMRTQGGGGGGGGGGSEPWQGGSPI